MNLSESSTVNKRLWLLVFDLDGTLIDSSRDLCDSVNAALAHLGRPVLPDEVVSGFIGDGAASLVRRALVESDGSRVLAETEFTSCFEYFLGYYRVHKLDSTRVYPGVLEALAAMRHERPDLAMAVLTNKPVRPSWEICTALGLAPFFFANYGGNSFATKKPHPEGLTYVINEASALVKDRSSDSKLLSPDGVVMIGDSEADVLVGKACGTRTLGCAYGLAPEALRRAEPDQLVDSPWEWPAALGFTSASIEPA